METDYIVGIAIYLIVIMSAVFHEFMHGWTADQLGDPTAKNLGRLTLNPLKHIDPFGTVLLPLMLVIISQGAFAFGYAKPVPYNPYNLSDQKWGSTKVAFAGPAANLVIALLMGMLLRFNLVSGDFAVYIALITYINVLLAIFNLIPVPPLDGSKLLMDIFPRSHEFMAQMSVFGIFIALFIGFYLLSDVTYYFVDLIIGDSAFLEYFGDGS